MHGWLLRADVPVIPDADQARDWILNELSEPQYQAAQPTWFDLLSAAFIDWLTSLDLTGGGTFEWPVLLIAAAVIAALLVAAFFIFGRARLNRRSAVAGALFGEDETRSADQLRKDAAAAAARGDWSTAIAERFRGLARALAERTIFSTSPGTTAHGFAAGAAAPFPEFTERLESAAASFDDVRYLGHPGTEAQYRSIAELDGELQTARPRLPAGALQ